jgi:hypothetical protein
LTTILKYAALVGALLLVTVGCNRSSDGSADPFSASYMGGLQIPEESREKAESMFMRLVASEAALHIAADDMMKATCYRTCWLATLSVWGKQRPPTGGEQVQAAQADRVFDAIDRLLGERPPIDELLLDPELSSLQRSAILNQLSSDN